jgi:hypothetical protein
VFCKRDRTGASHQARRRCLEAGNVSEPGGYVGIEVGGIVKDRRRFEGAPTTLSGWRRGVRRSLFARGSAQKGVEFGYLPPM